MTKHINIDEEAQRIMVEASRTPYLAPEEERRLVSAMKAGGRAGESAQSTLLAAHQRLVINCARRFAWCGKPLSDLIQEGNVGMVRAAQKFDPTKGVRFATYALWWVRESIKLLALDSDGPVYIPLKQIKEVARMNRIIRELNTDGRPPSDQLVAQTMGISLRKLDQLKKLALPTVHLNAKLKDHAAGTGDSRDTEFGDMLADPDSVDPDEEIDQKALTERLAQALSTLNSRERHILVSRFGVGCEKQTLEDLAQHYGLTRERIRQLEQSALKKLAKGDNGRALRQFLAA